MVEINKRAQEVLEHRKETLRIIEERKKEDVITITMLKD